MTFNDDFIRFQQPTGAYKDVFLLALRLDWPPPENVTYGGIAYKRMNMSQITDEQREGMSHVCRGAMFAVVSH